MVLKRYILGQKWWSLGRTKEAPHHFSKMLGGMRILCQPSSFLNNSQLSFPPANCTGHNFSPDLRWSGGGLRLTSRKLGAREAKKTILLGVPVRLRRLPKTLGREGGPPLRRTTKKNVEVVRSSPPLLAAQSQALIHLQYRHSRIGQFLGFGPRDKRSASSSSS